MFFKVFLIFTGLEFASESANISVYLHIRLGNYSTLEMTTVVVSDIFEELEPALNHVLGVSTPTCDDSFPLF